MGNHDWGDIIGTIIGVGFYLILPIWFVGSIIVDATTPNDSTSAGASSEVSTDASSDSESSDTDTVEPDYTASEFDEYSDYDYSDYEADSTDYDCNPNYSGCIENTDYDLDCGDIVGSVEVIGYDEYGFDRDGDGYGCEWN